jgi:hypothetical protein
VREAKPSPAADGTATGDAAAVTVAASAGW